MSKRIVCELKTVPDFVKFVKDNKYVIIKGTASWCGPCQRIKPLFIQLVNEMPMNVAVVIVDITSSPELKSFLKIGSVPYIMNYIYGEKQDVINTSRPDTIRNFFAKTFQRVKQ